MVCDKYDLVHLVRPVRPFLDLLYWAKPYFPIVPEDSSTLTFGDANTPPNRPMSSLFGTTAQTVKLLVAKNYHPAWLFIAWTICDPTLTNLV